jgi:hypothetical protein
MEKKREGDREAAGDVFLASDPLYHCFFGIGDWKGELLKLLRGCHLWYVSVVNSNSLLLNEIQQTVG